MHKMDLTFFPISDIRTEFNPSKKDLENVNATKTLSNHIKYLSFLHRFVRYLSLSVSTDDCRLRMLCVVLRRRRFCYVIGGGWYQRDGRRGRVRLDCVHQLSVRVRGDRGCYGGRYHGGRRRRGRGRSSREGALPVRRRFGLEVGRLGLAAVSWLGLTLTSVS